VNESGKVTRAYQFAEQLCNTFENLITGQMAMLVIGCFKVIKITDQQTKWLVGAFRPLHLLLQTFIKVTVIIELSQAIPFRTRFIKV
jgi:hypothetical protein